MKYFQSKKVIADTLKQVGIPGTYFCWSPRSQSEVPPLPWFVYRIDEDNSFIADCKRYVEIYQYRVEVYMKKFDYQLVEKFADVIEKNFGPFEYAEVWIEREHCYQASFTFIYTLKEPDDGE